MTSLKDYLLFITDEREEGERYLNVVFLEKGNAIYRFKDFTKDPSCMLHYLITSLIVVHMTWVNDKFFIANNREFKMIQMKDQEPLKDGEVRYIDIDKL